MTEEKINEIAERAQRLNNRQGFVPKATLIKDHLSLGEIIDFPVDDDVFGGVSITIYWHNGVRKLHSATKPAYRGDCPIYYLFNMYVQQHEWFDILMYGKEERLAHILKWGKHG